MPTSSLFQVEVIFNDFDPNAARVELYADGAGVAAPVQQEMKRVGPLDGTPGGYVYSAMVSAARPPADYTARVRPYCEGVAVPLEATQILWQR